MRRNGQRKYPLTTHTCLSRRCPRRLQCRVTGHHFTASCPYWLSAVEEEHRARGRNDSRPDRPNDDMARNHSVGGQIEPHAVRLGELLSSGNRPPSVLCDRQLHHDAGCVGRCATSTRSDVLGTGTFQTRTFTRLCVSYV